MNKGIVYAVGAYLLWGLFPIYYKLLTHVSALQLLSHRIVWSYLTLVGLVLLARQGRMLRASALQLPVLRTYTVAAVLIAINWLAFVWAVTTDRVIESSLGYFITPLVNVLLGVLFLRERLRPWQWAAVGLAATGVVYLTLSYGSPPWIALTLALSFGIYGLIKKTAPLGSVHGLTLETAILLLPAISYLVYVDHAGDGAFIHAGLLSDVLLVGAGILGTIPLLLFASATKRVSLSLIGVLFYIAPTLQFLLGVLVYDEAFTRSRFIGFGVVWAALVLFSVEGLLARRASVNRDGRADAQAAVDTR